MGSCGTWVPVPALLPPLCTASSPETGHGAAAPTDAAKGVQEGGRGNDAVNAAHPHDCRCLAETRRGGFMTREAFASQGPSCTRQGCADHRQPCVLLSILALHVWLQARLGVLQAGGLGAVNAIRVVGVERIQAKRHCVAIHPFACLIHCWGV